MVVVLLSCFLCFWIIYAALEGIVFFFGSSEISTLLASLASLAAGDSCGGRASGHDVRPCA